MYPRYRPLPGTSTPTPAAPTRFRRRYSASINGRIFVDLLRRLWPIVRVIVIGVVGYFMLLVALRASGPRSMARTNLFDLVIVVSIGSVYGRILTAKDVSLVEALVAY